MCVSMLCGVKRPCTLSVRQTLGMAKILPTLYQQQVCWPTASRGDECSKPDSHAEGLITGMISSLTHIWSVSPKWVKDRPEAC